MEVIGIYKITSPVNRVYIGQSIDVKNRWSDYKKIDCKGQPRLYNSLVKHGVKNHKFEVIEECDVSKLNERERYWQDKYSVLGKKGLNCVLTKTDSISGKRSYDVTFKISMTKYGRPPLKKKERIRYNMIGENNSFYGKNHSEETKRKISEANRGSNNYNFGRKGILSHNFGRKHSDEVNMKKGRKGIYHHFYGKTHNESTKIKTSQSRKGKLTLSDNHKSKRVINTETNEIYGCLKEVSILIGINYDTLRSRLKNKNYIYQWYESAED